MGKGKTRALVATLEARVSALEEVVEASIEQSGEGRRGGSGHIAVPAAEPAEVAGMLAGEAYLVALRAAGPAVVGFGGSLDSSEGEPAQAEEWAVADVLALDPAGLADVLSALASAHRLTLLRQLVGGERSSGDLVSALGEDRSAGQVYHHLKELQSAGWVEQVRRGVYRIPSERVIPLLVILAAVGAGLRA